MEKDKIFFAENGLTSTSANYYANIAKELYQNMESELENIVFYTISVNLIGTNVDKVLRKGTKRVSHIEAALVETSQLKSLIAWLREAIKAKERLCEEAQEMDFQDFGIEVPEKPALKSYITSEDVLGSWGIKQRNRYYYLESLCATIGGYIHPGGTYARERRELAKIIAEPNKVEGSGRDTLLYTREPSISQKEVEDMFLKLQNTYRGYQAELNSLKFEIEDTVKTDKINKDLEYARELRAYNLEMNACQADLTAKRKQAVADAGQLKIVIPDSLKDIFEKVRKAGKEK